MAQRFREAVIEGKPYDVEVETVTAKGNRRWIRVIGRPVYQGTRVRRVEGAIQDITARKGIEAESIEVQERFRRALSHAPFPMSIHAEDGEVILVNETWERISGYTLEDCPTVAAWTEKAYGEEAPRLQKIIADLFINPSRVDVGEFVIRTASGERRTWDFSTVPLGSLPDGRRMLLTCAMDITLRKRAQVQNAWIASLVKNSKDICVIKDLDLRVVAANPAFVRVAGKNSVEELLGKTDAEIFGIPEDRDPVRGYMEDERRARELEAGQFVDRIENVIFPDGKPRIFQTRKFPVFNDAGVLIATGNISTDITEKRRTEEQLRQAQKMESVGQLAGGVAHDFNNLLQAILGYAQLAAESLPESDPQLLEYFQHIRHCAEKAAAVTRQLLAFSRRQVLNPKYIDLNQIVGDLMKIVSRTLGEHIELKFIPQQDLHTVYVDPGQVEQIVLNLCVNSRDAMPEGGQLVIETGNRFLDEEYCRVHGWAKVGDYAVLTVSDTGEGMDAVTQNQIFDPFFTTKELGKGTGLGLATVYGIVAQHDGLIHVYSEVGRGTTFKVYFPAQGKKASTPTIRLEEKGPRGTERILLAEDDEAVRTLASKILEGAGYSVLVARNGEEARDLIDKHHAEIDIAILDVVMPKTSGKLVGDYFRSIRPGAHVLYSSGYTANAIQTGFQLEEGVDFLSKPYDPDDLLWKVRQVLDNQRE
jgi:PAS domain S-box-containing protein